MKLLNSVSLNMFSDPSVTIIGRELDKVPDLEKLESFVGHQQLADILGVKLNRSQAVFQDGEKAVVAQYIGQRLPEGATKLPKGAKVVFIEVTFMSTKRLMDRIVLDGGTIWTLP